MERGRAVQHWRGPGFALGSAAPGGEAEDDRGVGEGDVFEDDEGDELLVGGAQGGQGCVELPLEAERSGQGGLGGVGNDGLAG